MVGNVTVATRWLSIDGALFLPATGDWRPGGRSVVPARVPDPADVGLVGVDGAWFDPSRGQWATVDPGVTAAADGRPVPEGFVSVDGALLPVEPS